MSINVAADLRGRLISAQKSIKDERTQREQARAKGEVFAYAKALEVLHRAGLAEPGIDWSHSVGLPNAQPIRELVEYLGEQAAADILGPSEAWGVEH